MKLINPINDYKIDGVYIEITSLCNLRCIHCYNDSGVNKGTISFSTYKNLLDQLDVSSDFSVTISGGEPLLHPQIWDILTYTCQKKVNALIITNATLINEEIAKKIFDLGIKVQVSLNGRNESEHDVLCGSGSFKKTMRGLKCLINAGVKNIIIRCVLSQINKTTIEKFIGDMSKLTNYIDIGTLSIMGRGKNVAQYNIPLLEKNEILHKLNKSPFIVELRKNGKKVNIPENACTFGCPLMYIPQEGKAPLTPRIDVKGNVFLCQAFDNPLYALGNIYEKNFSEILGSEEFFKLSNFIMLGLDYMLECRECLWKSVCGKGCVAHILSDGTIQNTDGDCELRKKMLAQEAILQL